MCTVIRQRDLSAEDLAVLSARRLTHREADDDSPQNTLVIDEILPGDGFGFGPVTISQLVRPIDPRLVGAA